MMAHREFLRLSVVMRPLNSASCSLLLVAISIWSFPPLQAYLTVDKPGVVSYKNCIRVQLYTRNFGRSRFVVEGNTRLEPNDGASRPDAQF